MNRRTRALSGKEKTAVGAEAVNKTMVLWGNRQSLEPILPTSSEIKSMKLEEFQEWVRVIRPVLHQRLDDRNPLIALKNRIITALSRESDDQEKELAVSRAIQESGISFRHPYL